MKCDMKSFKNSDDYVCYMQDQIEKLNKSGEYNIFCHMIGDYSGPDYSPSEYSSSDELIKKRFRDMIKHGLSLHHYGSVNGRLAFMGSSHSKQTISKILKYEYYKNIKNKCVFVYAIPKYIDINGKKVEFSSYNGQCNPNEFFKYSDPQHTCCTLFDVLKDRTIPEEFLLGIQRIREDKSSYQFYQPNTHLSKNLSAENVKHLKLNFENGYKNLVKKHNTTDLFSLIKKESEIVSKKFETIYSNDDDY